MKLVVLGIGVAPEVHTRCKAPLCGRLFVIILMSHEAELHSQARRTRRRGGVSERCPAPQLSQSGRRPRGDTVRDQPSGASARGARWRALGGGVGAVLFIRTTRSVGLTEAGERFLLRARPAFEELVAASDVARDLGQRPTGLLRLSVPRAVVPILLEPLIASFCEAYPEVAVEVAASEDRKRVG